VETDILKPNTGYISVERPSHTPSSKSTSEPPTRQDTGILDDRPGPYAEPESDGDDDEEMDIHPAKDEHKRTGLSSVDVAEAIAFREKMMKEKVDGAQPRVKPKTQMHVDDVSDEADDEANETTPFIKRRKANGAGLEHLVKENRKARAMSIDPLAPSSAFDETLKKRLKDAGGRTESTLGDTAVEDEENEREDLEDPQPGPSNRTGDDRELVRHWTAPSGKRIAVPVRIEPKVYFAAERTFLVCFSLFDKLWCAEAYFYRNG
jgi:hypothetical protein